jgi:hypothetical protein
MQPLISHSLLALDSERKAQGEGTEKKQQSRRDAALHLLCETVLCEDTNACFVMKYATNSC